MSPNDKRPLPGDTVVLRELPPGLLDGLPTEDQQAIVEAASKPLFLNEYDDEGTAELEFTDGTGVIHFLYVNWTFIRSVWQFD